MEIVRDGCGQDNWNLSMHLGCSGMSCGESGADKFVMGKSIENLVMGEVVATGKSTEDFAMGKCR